ncbi:MAG: hypothetical protein AABZ47_04230 [Planctomycetota bacterium]
MNERDNRRIELSVLLFFLALSQSHAFAQLLSYAHRVKEMAGISLNDASLSLGPPDYLFADDDFTESVSVVYAFQAPLDDLVGDDLIVSIFVSAEGTDSTDVLIEARALETHSFVEIATLTTSSARNAIRTNPFAEFDHVHHFAINFDGIINKVLEVRVTNLSGAALMLDALEGIHPAIQSPNHAVELRIFRLRDDFSKRFALRFKNISPLIGGLSISGFSIEHATDAFIDQTDKTIVAPSGAFAATAATTAGPDNGDVTRYTEYLWTGDGDGLPPGEVATHQRFDTIDTDLPDDEFLENLTFTVTFSDGAALLADGRIILADGDSGQLFSLYQFPPSPVTISEPRPAFFYEFASDRLVPESPCAECNPDTDVDPGNDNGGIDEGGNGGNNGDGSGSIPVCNPGLIGLLLPMLGLYMTRLVTRKRL